jgi:hypothetical protein
MSSPRGVKLPPIAGDQETVSKTLQLMKLELEGEGDVNSFAKLTEKL